MGNQLGKQSSVPVEPLVRVRGKFPHRLKMGVRIRKFDDELFRLRLIATVMPLHNFERYADWRLAVVVI